MEAGRCLSFLQALPSFQLSLSSDQNTDTEQKISKYWKAQVCFWRWAPVLQITPNICKWNLMCLWAGTQMEESVEMPTWTQVCSSLLHTEFLFLSITFKRTKCYRRLLTRQHKGKANKEGTVLGKQLGASFMNLSQLWWKSHMTKYTWITTSTLTPDLEEALHLNPFQGVKCFRDADNTRTAWSGFGAFFRLPMPTLVLQVGTCFYRLFPTDQILSLDLLNFQAPKL